MKYADGQEIRLWDRVSVWSTDPARGVVVFSIDTDEYSAQFPRENWAYLGRGIMVDTDQAGPIHYAELVDELRLVARGKAFRPEDWAASTARTVATCICGAVQAARTAYRDCAIEAVA